MSIDLGLSFDSEDYEHIPTEDADVFKRKTYQHEFDGVCPLCDRRHFPGLKVPVPFQKQLRKHLTELGVEEGQKFIDKMDAAAAWQLPAQISSIAIEEESAKADGEEIPVFLRALADTLDELTGGELTRKVIIFSFEQKIITLHKAIKDLDVIREDLILEDDEIPEEESPNIADRVRDLLEFSRGVRQKRLDNLITMYRDECEDKGVEPRESVIKEGKFAEGSSMFNIMELLEGNEKL